MVCIRCGSQVEPVDNFCRNCGVRLKQSAGVTAVDESSRSAVTSAASSPRRRRLPSGPRDDARVAPPHERKGVDGATVFFGVFLLIAVAAASVYFGTHVLRQSGQRDRPLVADAPGSRLRDEINPTGEASDRYPGSVAQPRSLQPSAPAPLESLDQSPSVVSKPRPNTEASESSPRKPPLPTNEQQSTGSGRSAKIPASAPTSRRASAAGAYETRDSTPLFEQPSSSSRVVANIPGGTRVDVVNSKGDWLEVHSRRGNPPGFIRRQDAKFLEKTD